MAMILQNVVILAEALLSLSHHFYVKPIHTYEYLYKEEHIYKATISYFELHERTVF